MIKTKFVLEIVTWLMADYYFPDFDIRGKTITLAGWGLTSCTNATDPFCIDDQLAKILQEINLPVATATVCTNVLSEFIT